MLNYSVAELRITIFALSCAEAYDRDTYESVFALSFPRSLTGGPAPTFLLHKPSDIGAYPSILKVNYEECIMVVNGALCRGRIGMYG